MRKSQAKAILWGIALALLCACEPQEARDYEPRYGAAPEQRVPEYGFGVHPQRNPKKLHAIFGPLADYLSARVPEARFTFEASRHYESFDQRIVERRYAFILPNPYETLLAIEHGYRVFAKMGRDEDLRGLIVVRRDGAVRDFGDLEGEAVSFPAPTALAATMMPLYFLHSHGLKPGRDFEARYVGSMESSLLNVLRKNVAAGTVYPPAWRMFLKERPDQADELTVLWETDSLPNNSVMARADVPMEVVERVREVLLNMHETAEGRRILQGMDSPFFEPATDATYAPVRTFLQRYREAFGNQQQ